MFSRLTFWFVVLFSTERPVHTQAPVTAIALAPDTKLVLLGSQRGIEVLSYPGLELQEELDTGLAHINGFSFKQSGKRLLVAGGTPGESGEVELYSWPRGELVERFEGQTDLLYDVSWSPSGMYWASGGGDGVLIIRRTSDDKVIQLGRGHSKTIQSVTWLSDDLVVTAGLDQTIRLWAVGAVPGNGQLEKVEPIVTEPQRSLTNHVRSVQGVVSRPGERVRPELASVGLDKTVRIWQPTIGRLVRFARVPAPVLCARWSLDGRFVIVGCTDGFVRWVDAQRVKIVREEPVSESWVYDIAVTSKGDVVASKGHEVVILKAVIAE